MKQNELYLPKQGDKRIFIVNQTSLDDLLDGENPCWSFDMELFSKYELSEEDFFYGKPKHISHKWFIEEPVIFLKNKALPDFKKEIGGIISLAAGTLIGGATYIVSQKSFWSTFVGMFSAISGELMSRVYSEHSISSKDTIYSQETFVYNSEHFNKMFGESAGVNLERSKIIFQHNVNSGKISLIERAIFIDRFNKLKYYLAEIKDRDCDILTEKLGLFFNNSLQYTPRIQFSSAPSGRRNYFFHRNYKGIHEVDCLHDILYGKNYIYTQTSFINLDFIIRSFNNLYLDHSQRIIPFILKGDYKKEKTNKAGVILFDDKKKVMSVVYWDDHAKAIRFL